MAGRAFESAQRGKRQPANPPPPSAPTGACPKTPKMDDPVNKCCLTHCLTPILFCEEGVKRLGCPDGAGKAEAGQDDHWEAENETEHTKWA
jgi:hypothetical protein